jgi:hypothetical protein
MKISIALACLLVLLAPGKAQEIQDDYSIHAVKKVLEQPAGSSASFLEKQTNRLGDRASIALLKIFDAQDLSKPETVRRILPLIHDAFVAPQIISRAEDRKPKITLFMLTYLEHEVSASDLRQEISQTVDFVKQKTAADK